jgi:hypothetical protein
MDASNEQSRTAVENRTNRGVAFELVRPPVDESCVSTAWWPEHVRLESDIPHGHTSQTHGDDVFFCYRFGSKAKHAAVTGETHTAREHCETGAQIRIYAGRTL